MKKAWDWQIRQADLEIDDKAKPSPFSDKGQKQILEKEPAQQMVLVKFGFYRR